METLLIFLAIIGLQMLAAYSKQKKEAAKKAVKKPVYEPRREVIPQESSPVPDPFREIREAMGLPPADEPEYEPERFEQPEPEPEPKLEGIAPQRQPEVPFQSVTDRLEAIAAEEPVVEPALAIATKRRTAMDTSNLTQGILWTAILQEPRFKSKWKSKYSHTPYPIP